MIQFKIIKVHPERVILIAYTFAEKLILNFPH